MNFGGPLCTGDEEVCLLKRTTPGTRSVAPNTTMVICEFGPFENRVGKLC